MPVRRCAVCGSDLPRENELTVCSDECWDVQQGVLTPQQVEHVLTKSAYYTRS
jgi:predicted nucleic acid-binding Zn ribbon protein